MRSLFKNSVFNIIYTLLNIIFPFLTSIIASRILLPEGIGKVAGAQNYASYFVSVASLGLPVYGIRAIARCKEKPDQLKQTFTELLIINILSSALSAMVYFGTIVTIKKFKDEFILYFICGIQVLFNIFNIDWLYKGREEYSYIVVRSLIVKILSFTALIFFVKNIDDYCIYALISALALVGNYLFNIIHARSYITFKIEWLDLKKHIKPLLILAVSVVFAALYSKTDITMLGLITNDETVGLYTNAHKCINIVLSFVTAITAVYLPRLSKLSNEENGNELSTTVNSGIKIISLFAFPAFVGVIILAPFFINLLYGEAFAQALPTMMVFSSLIIIGSIGDLVCYQLLIAIGYEKKRVVANIAGAIVNIILNFILIPILKSEGAAIASVVSELCLNAYLFFVIRKKIKVKLLSVSFVKFLVASTLMGVVVYLLTLIEIPYWATCLFGICVGVCVYFVALLLMKENTIYGIFEKIKKRV